MSTFVADPDAQLMALVQLDDPASFNLLVARNRTTVLQYLSRMVQNQAVAEELAQDVFLRIYRSRHAWEPSAKFSTWLYRIATNVALNHFRDDRRHLSNVSLDRPQTGQMRRETRDQSPNIESLMLKEAVAAQVRRAVHGLPAKQRAAVILHKYHELDYTQIASVLECTPAAVKSILFRAYESLRLRLRHLSRGI